MKTKKLYSYHMLYVELVGLEKSVKEISNLQETKKKRFYNVKSKMCIDLEEINFMTASRYWTTNNTLRLEFCMMLDEK